MMIEVLDKKFQPYLKAEQIHLQIRKLAKQLNVIMQANAHCSLPF